LLVRGVTAAASEHTASWRACTSLAVNSLHARHDVATSRH